MDKRIAVYFELTRFLYREALALDERRFRDWLGMLADDITYQVPVRVTREAGAEWELAPTSRILDDDRQTLEVRVARLETEFAWAEQPPSRTRHFVTNVLVDTTDNDHEYQVHSSVLVYRSRGNDPDPSLYSLARKDLIRRDGERWLLARRWAALDQSMVNAHNMSIFI